MSGVRGFSRSQREWFRDRDGHHCRFLTLSDGKWVQCGSSQQLEVHHIVPRGWFFWHIPPTYPINGMDNGITLCKPHHWVIHPDMVETLMYGCDNSIFAKVMKHREALCRAGIPYWNTALDWMLNCIVRKANAAFKKPYPGNMFVEKDVCLPKP